MKHGTKKNKIAEKIVLSFIYFVFFSIMILLTGLMGEFTFGNPTFLSVCAYILLILITIVALILFIATWEQAFGSEDHS
jgi:ABC-type branched-subunit amino acid transport system permease subunit